MDKIPAVHRASNGYRVQRHTTRRGHGHAPDHVDIGDDDGTHGTRWVPIPQRGQSGMAIEPESVVDHPFLGGPTSWPAQVIGLTSKLYELGHG
jgi:hypothetical protein